MAAATPPCRSCGGTRLEVFLDLGRTPLADRLLEAPPAPGDAAAEPFFPLEVAFCPDCALVQILETVDPVVLFQEEYRYYSSFSPALLRHTRANVDELVESRGLGPDSFVVEPASNDGYLLAVYQEHGVPVLGIDPSPGPAAAAVERGVPTLEEFFTLDLARRLVAEGRRADVIHANNVLAHVPDTNGFVAALATLVKPGGVVVVEVPYLRDLIAHCEFDTIYHEHLCYFSVTALVPLFARHGLVLNDVRELAIHGGSLRLHFSPRPGRSAAVEGLLEAERAAGMDRPEFYRDFHDRVEGVRTSLKALLEGLRAEGHSIAAYGAAAKGSTLINVSGIGTDLVDFVVDRNVHKQGRYMPGKHLPIRAPEALLEDQPDYLLLLAWNFADEIMEQQAEYRARGGRFIVPVPEPRVV